MEGSEPDKRLELVMAEALRALSHQQSLLDNLRSRATLLTTAGALVGSLVGAPAIARGHLEDFGRRSRHDSVKSHAASPDCWMSWFRAVS